MSGFDRAALDHASKGGGGGADSGDSGVEINFSPEQLDAMTAINDEKTEQKNYILGKIGALFKLKGSVSMKCVVKPPGSSFRQDQYKVYAMIKGVSPQEMTFEIPVYRVGSDKELLPFLTLGTTDDTVPLYFTAISRTLKEGWVEILSALKEKPEWITGGELTSSITQSSVIYKYTNQISITSITKGKGFFGRDTSVSNTFLIEIESTVSGDKIGFTLKTDQNTPRTPYALEAVGDLITSIKAHTASAQPLAAQYNAQIQRLAALLAELPASSSSSGSRDGFGPLRRTKRT
jgi:hypothetical protein